MRLHAATLYSAIENLDSKILTLPFRVRHLIRTRLLFTKFPQCTRSIFFELIAIAAPLSGHCEQDIMSFSEEDWIQLISYFGLILPQR
ncbi:hypothetical protein GJ496_004850 [Pomphorhynchus laevis]|nr:hypothetical protein GJ496_004850 [Pomphorhynchus laevis]